MKLKQQRNQKGFTIIEVLIVLAIAGLIMLIVFLAVPALQRNSRNTQIKNDVASVIGGISEFQAANNGAMPTIITSTSGTVDYKLTATTGNNTTAKVQGSTNVSVVTTVPSAGNPTAGNIQVILGKKCDGSTNTRAAAAYYSIENTTSTPVQQCQDS